jgi:hypothetical protein
MTFIMATLKGAAIPPHVERPVADGEAFPKGAPLEVVAGEYVEAGAASVNVVAIANGGYGPEVAGPSGESGFIRIGTQEFPPGFMQGIPVEDQEFHAEFVGNIPAATDGTFNPVKGPDGEWRVNFAAAGTILRYLGTVAPGPLDAPWQNRVRVKFVLNATF